MKHVVIENVYHETIQNMLWIEKKLTCASVILSSFSLNCYSFYSVISFSCLLPFIQKKKKTTKVEINTE